MDEKLLSRSESLDIWTSGKQIEGSYIDISKELSESRDIPHRDESQVKLDTDRSYRYPGFDDSDCDALYNIIVSELRNRPVLRYYQGYHDIVQVLYLRCGYNCLKLLDYITVCYLRDFMMSSFDPATVHLTVFMNLMRYADQAVYRALQTVPIAAFALSPIITWFSHDIQDLDLLHLLFDDILQHESSIYVIYLYASFILSDNLVRGRILAEYYNMESQEQERSDNVLMIMTNLFRKPHNLPKQTKIAMSYAEDLFKSVPPNRLRVLSQVDPTSTLRGSSSDPESLLLTQVSRVNEKVYFIPENTTDPRSFWSGAFMMAAIAVGCAMYMTYAKR
ncbi:hypothetical protein CANCADRAFT_58479 [Tortispora caseinolytica NRRL Y-17796]|uniref:Rab-GAP TBC domain-containing protein n=1 Tax=Tortispora caseinolytica NRRL Y-17796 TaxID=767744 RepID=A0A1E4TCU8_9ASCO|nr:hypothetical protein CANCADRAFT_58479 [Tortispora caseinolytica NRRL Y-17796]